MFDATKGNQKVTDHVDELTDEFAALFTDLKPRQQQVIMSKMNELMSNPDSIDAFSAGTYAQNSSGQPAQALGAGPSSGTVANDPAEAIKVILADTSVDAGLKHLIRRAFDQSAPDNIEVEADGTPKELKNARKERDTMKTEKEAAEKELKDERDENKTGSLAAKLKDAKANAATPADMVEKSKVKAKVDDLKAAVAHLTAPVGKVRGKAEVEDAVDELEKLC